MRLTPLTDQHLAVAESWLHQEKTVQWLDFGGDRQGPSVNTLGMMLRSPSHRMMLICADLDDRPVGLMALSQINRVHRTAAFWGLRADIQSTDRRNATDATHEMLRIGFEELGLNAISAWAVESNRLSVRALKTAGFVETGRQRHAHVLDGQPHDRLTFDIVRDEYLARCAAAPLTPPPTQET